MKPCKEKDAYASIQDALLDGRRVREIPLYKENLTADDFAELERQAIDVFAKAEAETTKDTPAGRSAASKARRKATARDYRRKARRNMTPEQKRRQVEWTRNWRKKCRQK